MVHFHWVGLATDSSRVLCACFQAAVCHGKKKTIEELVQSQPMGADPGGEMGRLDPKEHKKGSGEKN